MPNSKPNATLASLKTMATALVNIGITKRGFYHGPICSKPIPTFFLYSNRPNSATEAAKQRHDREMSILTRGLLSEYALRQIKKAKSVADLNGFMYAWTGSVNWTEDFALHRVGGHMQRRISTAYKNAMANPNTELGKRRLMREFNELQANLNAHLMKRRRNVVHA